MTDRFRQIFLYCEECIRCYDPNPALCITPDAHLAVYLPKRNITEPDEKSFVRHVLVGVTKYKTFLDTTIQCYCDVLKRAKQEDGLAFSITIYLALFRINEIGVGVFKALVDGCTTPSRLSELLRFIFDITSAKTNLVPRWKTVYDDDYVDRVIVGAIEKHSEAMLNMATAVEGMIPTSASDNDTANSNNNGNTKSSTTGTKRGASMKASQSERKRSPPGPRIPSGVTVEFESYEKVQQLPRVKDTATQAQIKAVNAAKTGAKITTLPPEIIERNRRKEEESRTAIKPFKMRTDEIQRTRSKAVEETLQKLYDEAQPEVTNVKSPEEVRERLQRQPARRVKMTHAAMLREDQFYEKQQEEILAALHKKETELRDDSEFKAWQKKQLDKDDEDRRQLIFQRKIDMRLADDAAKEAKRAQIHANQEYVSQLKQGMTEERRRQFEAQLSELAHLRIHAEEQQELMEKRLSEAKGKLNNNRIQGASAVRTESQTNELNLALNFEMERQRKADLIQQFKEAHQQNSLLREGVVPGVKGFVYVRPLDKEATNQLGILNEMSLAQLQRELCRVKEENNALENIRRESIISHKIAKEDEAEERRSRIELARSRVRTEKEEARRMRRDQETQNAEQRRVVEEKQLRELQAKLQESREAKEREEAARKAEDRARRVASQLLAADAGAMEEKRWAEMERGASNAALKTQNERILAQRLHRNILNSQQIIRENNLEAEATMREDARLWSDEVKTLKMTEGKTRAEQEYALKAQLVERERNRLKALRANADANRVGLSSARSAPGPYVRN